MPAVVNYAAMLLPPSHDVDHCGHWFGHTWLLESFKATYVMVARVVMVVAVKA